MILKGENPTKVSCGDHFESGLLMWFFKRYGLWKTWWYPRLNMVFHASASPAPFTSALYLVYSFLSFKTPFRHHSSYKASMIQLNNAGWLLNMTVFSLVSHCFKFVDMYAGVPIRLWNFSGKEPHFFYYSMSGIWHMALSNGLVLFICLCFYLNLWMYKQAEAAHRLLLEKSKQFYKEDEEWWGCIPAEGWRCWKERGRA